jgi:hypothetical protein
MPPDEQLSFSDQTFSEFLNFSVKKNLKFFHFLGMVADVITFVLHNFVMSFGFDSTPENIFK